MTLRDDVRDWVGDDLTDPTNDVLDEQLARFDQDANLAALAILKRRRAAWLSVTDFAIAGDVSEKGYSKDQLAALDSLIARLENETDTGATPVDLPVLAIAPIHGRSR